MLNDFFFTISVQIYKFFCNYGQKTTFFLLKNVY